MGWTRHTYRVDLAYDGSLFAGFRQQQGQRTVERALLEALDRFVPGIGSVGVGARTDRGVHATGQVISFYARGSLPLHDVGEAIEQQGLVVRDIRGAPNSFHASFCARARRYVYRLCEQELDVPRRDALVGALVGRRCFHAFARRTPRDASTIRRLIEARVRGDGPERVRFELCADRFLRRQVRVMVATALREMRRGAPTDALLELSKRRDRAATAPPAPAGGLFLVGVTY